MVVKVPMVSVASDPNEMSPGPSCECDRKFQDSYQLNLSQERHREEDGDDYEEGCHMRRAMLTAEAKSRGQRGEAKLSG